MQALALCGLQGLGRSRVSALRLVQRNIGNDSDSTSNIMFYKITHDQSTSSPEEDSQYAVETSRSTSHVTTS